MYKFYNTRTSFRKCSNQMLKLLTPDCSEIRSKVIYVNLRIRARLTSQKGKGETFAHPLDYKDLLHLFQMIITTLVGTLYSLTGRCKCMKHFYVGIMQVKKITSTKAEQHTVINIMSEINPLTQQCQSNDPQLKYSTIKMNLLQPTSCLL